MSSTGIALFAYRRPDHLNRVLDGLEANDVSHLYVFADGPQSEAEREQVAEVRERIRNIDWCSVTLTAPDHNRGLARSIISGVERVFEDHDRIIVLEDDCVPAPDFVSFMRTCLDRYNGHDRVMSVSGYSPPISIPDMYPYDIYFTHRASSWGWGTWQSTWEHFDYDPMTLDELRANHRELRDELEKAGDDLYQMMHNQLRGEIDSWAVWWAYTVASEDGVCVNPVDSRIKNIGHDGSGTHSSQNNRYDVALETTDNNLAFPSEVSVSDTLNTRFNRLITGSSHSRLRYRIVRLLRSLTL